MPKYKLIYFDLRFRGEIIRLLFKVAGVEFEDYRVKMNDLMPAEEWTDLKKKTPFGQLPVLQVDGEELAQSHAIERFLAREFGLDGNTSLEKAKVDMWIEAADEIMRRVSDNFEQSDPKLQEEEKQNIKTNVAPLVLGTLAKTLTANKEGFIVGSKLTVADLAFLSLRDWLKSAWGQEGMDLLNSFKPVSDHIQKVAEVPAIAQWLKTRPETL